jgi:hypothetical protein
VIKGGEFAACVPLGIGHGLGTLGLLSLLGLKL